VELATIGKDEQRVSALRTGAVMRSTSWQEIKALEKDPAVKVRRVRHVPT
jgi:hypothetical protein